MCKVQQRINSGQKFVTPDITPTHPLPQKLKAQNCTECLCMLNYNFPSLDLRHPKTPKPVQKVSSMKTLTWVQWNEMSVQKSHVSLMFRCAQTFGYILLLHMIQRLKEFVDICNSKSHHFSILLHVSVNVVVPLKPEQSQKDSTCSQCLTHSPFVRAVFIPSFIFILCNSTNHLPYHSTPYIPTSNLYKTAWWNNYGHISGLKDSKVNLWYFFELGINLFARNEY